MPQDWTPEDWGEEQAHRVAQEIRRLRGKRSTQWLADRTAELGCPVSRSVIADLENGRRRYVTTAELVILAAALDTLPIALMYPGPYRENVQVMPKLEVPEIWAVQWFSGLLRSISNVPFDDEGKLIQMPSTAAFRYYDNLRRLHRARAMWELDERRNALLRDLARKRSLKNDGLAVDDEISQLVDAVADLQLRIDELDARGDAPLDDGYEALVNRPYGDESSEGQSGR